MTELKTMEHMQVSSLTRAPFLLGGLLLIVAGALRIVDLQTLLDVSPTVRDVANVTSVASGVLAIVVGFAALLGTRQVSSPAWNIVLLVLGVIVAGLGGVLVLVGSIVGLVSIYIKN